MIREEDEQCVKSLTQSEIKILIKNCDYFSHIVFPYESQKILQQLSTKSLSSEQPKKWPQLQPHILNSSTNRQKQISHITQLLHLLTAKKDSFNRICVQLFYFMFSCMKQNIVVDFHEQCFVYSGSRAKFMVVLKQVMRCTNQKVKELNYFRLYVKIISQLVLALEQNILKIEHKVQLIKDDKDSMQSQNIDKVFNEINLNIVNAKNTIKYLRHFIVSAERVETDIKIEVNCFKQLEKQQFISQNSILRKMTHKSINIYLHKLASKQSQDKLIAAIKSEAKFTKLYNAIKSTAMGTEEKLAQVYEAITSNFEKYIQQCWKQNPAYVKIAQPISSDSKQPTDQKPMLFKVKYKTRNEGRNPEQKPPKQKERILQYGVQYHHNTEFPSLVLRLHTQITLQPSTTDQQLQKLNMYAFGSDYFSIEIGTYQKNKKTIILKTISKLIRGSSILLHFLRYTDMLMAAQQVIEHQDIGKVSLDDKDGKLKNEEIVKEIVHYSGLVSDLSMNYYDLAVKSG